MVIALPNIPEKNSRVQVHFIFDCKYLNNMVHVYLSLCKARE